MTEQKLINTYIDPLNAARAMDQIRAAAGDPSWRIVNIVRQGNSVDAKRVSPGINDPARLDGEPVLVVLERAVSDFVDPRTDARSRIRPDESMVAVE